MYLILPYPRQAPGVGRRLTPGMHGPMRPRRAYDSLGSAYDPCRGGPAGT
jgi:hypothetical protein